LKCNLTTETCKTHDSKICIASVLKKIKVLSMAQPQINHGFATLIII